MRPHFVIAALCALALAACDASHTRHDTRVTLIDSVRITESEQLYVGMPNDVAAGANGTVFISDVKEHRVLRVDATGHPSIVASNGGGPGEVTQPIGLAVVGDSMLAVKNAGQRMIALFDLAPVRFRGNLPVAFRTSAISSWKGSLVLSAMVPDSMHAFALVADSTHPPMRGGSVPEIYRRLPPIAQAFGTVLLSRDDSTVSGVFEASNTMYRWHLGRTATDSVVLSATTRRGAKPAVLEALMRDPTKIELVYTWSFPMLLATQSGERTAVVFSDLAVSKGKFTGPSYVQMVDWRRRVSCREFALPVPADVPPRFAMRGDTLIAVVQHADSTTGASSWIIRWRMGADGC